MCSSGEWCNFAYSLHVFTMCHLGTVTPQNLKLCVMTPYVIALATWHNITSSEGSSVT